VIAANGIKILTQGGLGNYVSQIRECETVTSSDFMPAFGDISQPCPIEPGNGSCHHGKIDVIDHGMGTMGLALATANNGCLVQTCTRVSWRLISFALPVTLQYFALRYGAKAHIETVRQTMQVWKPTGDASRNGSKAQNKGIKSLRISLWAFPRGAGYYKCGHDQDDQMPCQGSPGLS